MNLFFKHFRVFLLLALLGTVFVESKAQGTDEQRFKVELKLVASNKEVLIKLNSASISFARYPSVLAAAADTAKTKITDDGSKTIYINLDGANIGKEALSVLTKRNASLKGIITVTDSYSKSIVKTMEFNDATLVNFSDQVSSYSYTSLPGNMGFSLSSKSITIDGIVIEP
ncbi:hypothetical protein [Sphingobacterium sp. LRF_L2]|uniref:hypothetical protein n=1 Tax=Sphingobacterium sp. LRF_L2 TaxID=3369421 RepID=UPI003F5ED7ED